MMEVDNATIWDGLKVAGLTLAGGIGFMFKSLMRRKEQVDSTLQAHALKLAALETAAANQITAMNKVDENVTELRSDVQDLTATIIQYANGNRS